MSWRILLIVVIMLYDANFAIAHKIAVVVPESHYTAQIIISNLQERIDICHNDNNLELVILKTNDNDDLQINYMTEHLATSTHYDIVVSLGKKIAKATTEKIKNKPVIVIGEDADKKDKRNISVIRSNTKVSYFTRLLRHLNADDVTIIYSDDSVLHKRNEFKSLAKQNRINEVREIQVQNEQDAKEVVNYIYPATKAIIVFNDEIVLKFIGVLSNNIRKSTKAPIIVENELPVARNEADIGIATPVKTIGEKSANAIVNALNYPDNVSDEDTGFALFYKYDNTTFDRDKLGQIADILGISMNIADLP